MFWLQSFIQREKSNFEIVESCFKIIAVLQLIFWSVLCNLGEIDWKLVMTQKVHQCLSQIDRFIPWVNEKKILPLHLSLQIDINWSDRFDGVNSWCLTTKMANSIEIFQFIQTYNQTIGIIPSQLNRFGYSINVKNVLFFIFILPYIVSLTAFLMFKVKAMLDIGISVFILISMVSTIFFYIIPMCQTEDTSMFIENCERFIAGSKYKRGKFILRFWAMRQKIRDFYLWILR